MRVRWTTPTLQQLGEARQYIELENPTAADALSRRIEEVVGRLAHFPEMGRTGRRASTRELVVASTNFIVAFRVTAESIDIIAVLHGARRWPDAL